MTTDVFFNPTETEIVYVRGRGDRWYFVVAIRGCPPIVFWVDQEE